MSSVEYSRDGPTSGICNLYLNILWLWDELRFVRIRLRRMDRVFSALKKDLSAPHPMQGEPRVPFAIPLSSSWQGVQQSCGACHLMWCSAIAGDPHILLLLCSPNNEANIYNQQLTFCGLIPWNVIVGGTKILNFSIYLFILLAFKDFLFGCWSLVAILRLLRRIFAY
jgi:hypothetical protein